MKKKFVFSCLFSLIFSSTVVAVDKTQYRRPDHIPFPASNPYSAAKATLGKMLFFDPRLSKNRNLTCATCHNPSFGWEDATARSVGSQNTELGRHSPTIINVAWGNEFFWDGRAGNLEAQAQGPIEAAVEMNISMDEVVDRLSQVSGYRNLFTEVFGDTGLNETNVRKAIATFERTIVSGESPFDRWVEGDENAISLAAKSGFKLFNGKAGCVSCHSGWNFTDQKYHDIGLASNDKGRALISGNTEHNFAFKTPSLRNISQRAPYMHDGSMNDLTEVIKHYSGRFLRRDSLSPLMISVRLSPSEIADIEAFLLTLTGKDAAVSLPILPY
ncbi:tryptophan tryptophylquinone biosynthesis enzyme MauG [Parashewanella spongiae]|uniref:Methylamine utilization protein MauG n=1 Tax=Parashewanella spongiae TaxID=342950 RepID=A0A3A6U0Q9_9GAMM|nr:cytochrome c peroxidase [Parashewanella spongiae]MCL1076975.1 c-type cytochrome [Parashewanella spongiae]RJY18909.1 tryptophan tryptophylquinone biosynthesis enzyme MauG [Parashewanella spongiae]